MVHKIFFSWQSDVRSRAGRGLIEDSLKAAIKVLKRDSELEPAQRDMEVDRDVKKTPGHPPLMEVIFDKIARAAVFVGDMTYVGQRKNGRRTPNPNVLIEYGWASCPKLMTLLLAARIWRSFCPLGGSSSKSSAN